MYELPLIEESPIFPHAQRSLFLNCLTEFQRVFEGEFVEVIKQTVHYFDPPKEIANVSSPLQELIEYLNSLDKRTPQKYLDSLSQNPPPPDDFSISEKQLPVLKRAIMSFRRARALHIESFKERTHNADLLTRLEAELQPLNELVNQQWFKETTPITLPNLTNYLHMHHIEAILSNKGIRFEKRQYDEKFHILQAPQLFLRDLDYYRKTCEIRGVPVVVAHIDIDDFKSKFNSKHGHTSVDRNVLPRFMTCLESHVHSHGHSYRYGGDEYAMLIPSMSFFLAALFLDELRKKLAALSYRNTEEKTTVSIGLCVVDLDCFLTDREIEERANRAMNFAKEQGKNCIATYRSARFDPDELYVHSQGRN